LSLIAEDHGSWEPKVGVLGEHLRGFIENTGTVLVLSSDLDYELHVEASGIPKRLRVQSCERHPSYPPYLKVKLLYLLLSWCCVNHALNKP